MKAPFDCWYWMIFLMKARPVGEIEVDVSGVIVCWWHSMMEGSRVQLNQRVSAKVFDGIAR